MRNICPQRGCDAVHNLDDEDIDRPFRCQQCGTLLTFDGANLKIASPAETPAKRSAPQPPPQPEETPGMQPAQEGGVFSLLLTLLFGIGAVLVIVFLFLPVLDQTRILGKNAEIEQGDRKERRANEGDLDKDRLPSWPPEPKDKDKESTEESKTRKGEKIAWKKQKKALTEQVDELRIGARRSLYGYTWGMLAGFLCLAVASVGFLGPNQGRTRRVVGSIVICAQVLLIFLTYLIASTATRMLP
jgi:hypothetical protein